jgi:hypothetical protein
MELAGSAASSRAQEDGMNQFALDLNPGWSATRAEGLARLDAFRPSMGRAYAARRNYDLGPGRRDNVSTLSPWVRRRLVTEQELVRAALGAHSAGACEKFVQEVFWRSYWKGWLEMRPSVWAGYRAGLAQVRADAAEDRRLAKALARAEAGETGIACFDAWAQELVATGYLHNHARMWFASIWIFTLRLPWQAGADFFLRHLLDGDPASNTLGWRWVGGLHTPGKHYLAQAWNIAKFTEGRFEPSPRELDETAAPLSTDAPPPAAPLPAADRFDPARPAALLVTEEDLTPETLHAEGLGCAVAACRAVATLQMSEARSDLPVSAAVRDFDRAGLADAADRLRAAGAPPAERLTDVEPGDLARWARRAGAAQVVTAWAPVGPVRDWLERARPVLAAEGAPLVMLRRRWDEAVWPHATAGFFKVKDRIPKLLQTLA